MQYGVVWCSMIVFDNSENLHNVIHNYTVPLHYQAVGTLKNHKFVLPCFFGAVKCSMVQYGAVKKVNVNKTVHKVMQQANPSRL